MNHPVKQHVVSQVLLNRFAENGQFAVFDLNCFVQCPLTNSGKVGFDKNVIANFDQKDFYTITLYQENGLIFSKLSLLGEIAYRVQLGKYPFSLVGKDKFGCAHSFSLLSSRVTRLHSAFVPILTKKFDLFCRLEI